MGQLHYCGSAALHAQKVQVQADNARVMPKGTMDTWLDRRPAGQQAYEAGARSANNHPHVAPACNAG